MSKGPDMRQDSIHTFLVRAQTHQYGKLGAGIARIGTINIGHQYRPIAQWNGDVFFEDNAMLGQRQRLFSARDIRLECRYNAKKSKCDLGRKNSL